jgi:hypothetical protein
MDKSPQILSFTTASAITTQPDSIKSPYGNIYDEDEKEERKKENNDEDDNEKNNQRTAWANSAPFTVPLVPLDVPITNNGCPQDFYNSPADASRTCCDSSADDCCFWSWLCCCNSMANVNTGHNGNGNADCCGCDGSNGGDCGGCDCSGCDCSGCDIGGCDIGGCCVV